MIRCKEEIVVFDEEVMIWDFVQFIQFIKVNFIFGRFFAASFDIRSGKKVWERTITKHWGFKREPVMKISRKHIGS